MKHSTLCLFLAGLLTSGACAVAAEYPDRAVKVVVPASPGGGADFVTRILSVKLGEIMGQPIVVENRAGASGTIAADLVAKSTPNGYTLLMAQSTSAVIAPHLYKKLSYDPINDLTPVTLVALVPNMLVVNPSVPAKTVKEFIALARAKPGMLNFGSSGKGAPSHLAGESFKRAAGVDMVHVPYKGAGPAVNALISGEIQVMFAPMVSVLPHVKSGRLKAIAVTSAERSQSAPEIPTIAESGLPDFEINSWFGLFVPANTPGAIIDRLHRDTAAALKNPDVIARYASEGAEPGGNTPAQFSAFVRAEYVKYGKVVKDSGAQLE
jgi:tripartite-type tricarboxylate transporter receptor subunit TctC